MFEILRNDEAGENQGLYYIKYNSYYVAENSNHGVYLTATPTSDALWSFMAVETRHADYYSIVNPTTSGRITEFTETMESMNYTVCHQYCVSAEDAFTSLVETNDIFMYAGHGVGGKAGISFQTEQGNNNGYIAANKNVAEIELDHTIDGLDENSLSSLRCVFYLGCRTGTDYTVNGVTYNLVDSTYKKGAHFVLGTKQIISIPQIHGFFDSFLGLCTKKSLGESIVSLTDGSPIIPVYYLGDLRQYLNVG